MLANMSEKKKVQQLRMFSFLNFLVLAVIVLEQSLAIWTIGNPGRKPMRNML
jgi:hypothetical protein